MNARLSASHVAGTTRAFSARQPHSLQVHCSLSIDRRIHGKFSKKICSVLGASRERSMLQVCCMANARRMARVSKQIEREIGILFVSDKVVQAAVCPERRRGIDDGLSALASVTEVEISNDLQVAKVYLSIYSDESGKTVAMRGLKNIEGYVRKHIGRKIRLRLTPEIRFILDDSIERSERVLSLLKRVESINAGDAPPPPVSIADDFDDDFDIFYEDGDGDQGVISSVDLGFYDDDDGPANKRSKAATVPVAKNEKDGPVSLSEDDVEEMLTFFKQDATNMQKRGKNRRK